jgi:hypothetical protein
VPTRNTGHVLAVCLRVTNLPLIEKRNRIGKRDSDGKPPTLLLGIIFVIFSVLCMLLLSSCGVTTTNPPPPPAIGVSVSPTSASVLLDATQQFTATVTNTTNPAVTWNVNGIAGGNSTVGTISVSGLYTAPQILPQQASVNVQAVSQADATASGSANVTITGGALVTVTIAPTGGSVVLGATQQFTATVGKAANQSVIWNVNGIAGGNSAIGTISATGLFTAPQTLPQPAGAVIQAVSVADSAASASVTVAITSDVAVSVTPPSASVELGAAQTFVPHIASAGNPNPTVTWTLTGTGCANSACGIIDANGNYTAPGILPSPAAVTVTARSVADATKTATVPVAITSRFTLIVTGTTSVNTGAAANYVATLTPLPKSNPNLGISWTVTGTGCTGTACGTISPSGATAIYQAPALAPFPSVVAIIATPAADPTKAFSLSVTIVPPVSVAVTPGTATVPLQSTQTFTAQVTGTPNTNVTWDVNGVVGGNATLGTVTNISGSTTTTYTAPAVLLVPPSVIVHAVSVANPAGVGQATVTLSVPGALLLTPTSSTLAVSHRQPFNVTISGSQNTNVIWQVAGIPGGNTTVGQICVVASNPCQPVSVAPAGSIEYLSPAAVPSPNPLTLTVSSQAFPAQTQSAQITILAHIVVTVSPPSASLAPATTQQFAASILGTTNQAVTWNVTGTACSAAGIPCGLIDANGLYTAPISTPSPNAVNVVATSSEDTSRTGSASVTITNAITITSLLPASVTAGGVGSFTLQILGGNFALTSPGPGSTILINGNARTTNCISNGTCTTALSSNDLANAGNLAVTIQNPDSRLSNTVNFVVVANVGPIDIIPVTPANPNVTGKDIIVVEPSTAGSIAPQADVTIAVAAMGIFSPAQNTCTLGAGSLVITRPATGTATLDICIFSVSGLDPSFAYSITGPGAGDITIIGKQPLGLGIVDLTLAIPASTLKGLRSIFIQNPNQDKAVATGVLEVQ